jgi:hypothetical protein
MEKEEDEKEKESAEDETAVSCLYFSRGFGVVRYPRGLQLKEEVGRADDELFLKLTQG